MSAPSTGFELYGRWTTVDEETSFLNQVADETDAVLSIAGESVLGNQIWRVDLGNPDGPTMMILANVHGTEPSGRDAALALLRDLAYSTDPDVVDWLSRNRIVFCPNFNPDGFSRGRRQNANGLDLHWDGISITQPESRAVKRVLQDAKPLILVDMHQYETSRTEEWHPSTGATPGGDPGLKLISDDILDDIKGYLLTEHGWLSNNYPPGGIRWSGTIGSALAYHTVVILSEARFNLPHDTKVDIGRAVFDRAMEILDDRHSEIFAAIQASRNNLASSTDPIPIPDREFIGSTPPTAVPDPGTYVFTSWVPPVELLDLHGIEANPDGSISTAQHARLLIAALFEPESTSNVVGAPEWSPVVGSAFGFQIKVDGVTRHVEKVFVKQSGVQRRVDRIAIKEGGVQRVVQ